MSNDPSIDRDTAEDIRDDIEAADDDVSTRMRWTAGAKLALLFGGIGTAVVVAIWTGIIDPSVSVEATVDASGPATLLVYGVVVAFLIYVGSLIVIWLPGSVLSLLGGLALGAAHAAGYIDEEE